MTNEKITINDVKIDYGRISKALAYKDLWKFDIQNEIGKREHNKNWYYPHILKITNPNVIPSDIKKTINKKYTAHVVLEYKFVDKYEIEIINVEYDLRYKSDKKLQRDM